MARPLAIGRARADAAPQADGAPLEANPQAGPLEPNTVPFELPTRHLVTHGVVMGMTGSGKTGLTVVLVEEALRSGVPVLAVDVKGDLTNLLLALSPANPQRFEAWIDPDEAARDGRPLAEQALELATKKGEALAASGLTAADVEAYASTIAARVITPLASIGEPLDALSALSTRSALWDEDAEAAHDQLEAALSLVLRLAGLAGDPLSREHVVLSAFALRRVRSGKASPLAELVRDLLDPPLAQIGAMEFAEFLPPRDAQALAQRLNTLLASPRFDAWSRGAPLDVASWMRAPAGKTSLVLVSVAHLDDEERQLMLGILFDELLSWVRGLAGTSELRALVVFDEVFGFLPPHPANPPTKKPLLALMKQARAFGVGVLLATQNPMDLDYKALSNAGAWFLGRLLTDADRERVVEGLRGSDGGLGGLEPSAVSAVLKGLAPRTFLARDVHKSPAVSILETRQAMSWLRGPLTRRELARLAKELAPRPAEPAPLRPAPAPPQVAVAPLAPAQPPANGAAVAVEPSSAPPLPEGLRRYFAVPPAAPAPGDVWSPWAVATVLVRGKDAKLAAVAERRHSVAAPFDHAGRLDLSRARLVDPTGLEGREPTGVRYAELPSGLESRRFVQSLEKTLREHVSANCPIELDVQRALALSRRDVETPEAFAQRVRVEAERRLASEQSEVAAKHAPAIAKLEAKLAAARQALAAAEQAAGAAPSDLGAAFVRLALGRDAATHATKERSRAQTALSKAREQCLKAEADVRAAYTARDADLHQRAEAARRALNEVERVRLFPKKGDAEVLALGIVWSP
ncbi:MAG: helicase HerA-like domain-containing protein [Polyangiaceae bacterium]